MAIVTKTIGHDGTPDGGYVEWQIDYDDARLRLTAVRCINNSTSIAWGKAVSVANPSRSYSTTFPANQTTVINIPTGASQRLDITVDARGRVDGVDYQFMVPAP